MYDDMQPADYDLSPEQVARFRVLNMRYHIKACNSVRFLEKCVNLQKIGVDPFDYWMHQNNYWKEVE
jgi:hypothetical protein